MVTPLGSEILSGEEQLACQRRFCAKRLKIALLRFPCPAAWAEGVHIEPVILARKTGHEGLLRAYTPDTGQLRLLSFEQRLEIAWPF